MNVFIDGIQIFTTIAVDSVKQHALLPLAFALGRGRAIQQPLAIATISGLIMQLPRASAAACAASTHDETTFTRSICS